MTDNTEAPRTPVEPIKGMDLRREPGFIALTGAVAVSAFALVAVVIALLSATSQRNDLQDELTCRSRSAVPVDAATAEELAAIGYSLSITQDALGALGNGDDVRFRAALEAFTESQERLVLTADELAAAVQSRNSSLESCSN